VFSSIGPKDREASEKSCGLKLIFFGSVSVNDVETTDFAVGKQRSSTLLGNLLMIGSMWRFKVHTMKKCSQ
jgi:hypothetical protein